MFATSGQEFEYAKARHNRMCGAFRGIFPRRSPIRRCGVLRRARRDVPTSPSTAARPCWPPGWPGKQPKRPTAALSRLPPGGGIAYKKAELFFAAATAALAAGHPADARSGPLRPAGCSGRRVGSTGRRAPASFSPRPGTPRGSIGGPAPVCRAGRRPARRVPGGRGDAGAPARRAHRAEPGEREKPTRISSAPHSPAAAAHRCPGAWPGWPGPCRPTRRATPGPPSRPAAEASTPSRSTRCGSGPPSCARTARRTAASSPRWPSATRSGAATSVGCCSGANDGGRRRWPSGARRSVEDKELAAELEALRSVSRLLGRPRGPPRAGTPWSASDAGSRPRSRPARAGCPAATSPGKASSTWTSSSTSSARPR